MYVLLNLKDETMLQNVVQLLFQHGHKQLAIGDTIENLCPTCEKHSTSSSSASDTPMPPEFVCSTPIKNDELRVRTENSLKRPYESVSVSPIMSIENGKYEDISVKEEPSDEGLDDHYMSGDVDEDLEELTLSQALELFESSGFPKKPMKRPKIEEPFGELYQCQLCKKRISRHGQYANLLNHLSRHARLHASKKQYCCPKCGASFTRRYLASTHIKEVHNELKLQPHDFAMELREEYKNLLETCFPGVDTRKKQPSSSSSSNGTKDPVLSILSDDSGVSLPDASELNISTSDQNVVEVHVGASTRTDSAEETFVNLLAKPHVV